MNRHSGFPAPIVAAFVAAGVLALTGCGGSSHPAASAGGETTCKDFTAAKSATKDEIIQNYLRGIGKDTSRGNVATTRLSAEAFCRTSGKNKLVRDITTG
ncbi:hypothetical protein ACWDSJ_02055 [Nocardia sp. NPDC003482]|uniref:hypothetical protein n=1 Tax=Nocardia sp. NPDC004068 TaxID=3364303 RepID=UPI0036C01C62